MCDVGCVGPCTQDLGIYSERGRKPLEGFGDVMYLKGRSGNMNHQVALADTLAEGWVVVAQALGAAVGASGQILDVH